MSLESFLGAEFDRDMQNWTKILGMGQKRGADTKKWIHTHGRFTRTLGLFF